MHVHNVTLPKSSKNLKDLIFFISIFQMFKTHFIYLYLIEILYLWTHPIEFQKYSIPMWSLHVFSISQKLYLMLMDPLSKFSILNSESYCELFFQKSTMQQIIPIFNYVWNEKILNLLLFFKPKKNQIFVVLIILFMSLSWPT